MLKDAPSNHFGIHGRNWEPYLYGDWGSSRPTVVLAVLQCRRDYYDHGLAKQFRPGDVVFVREYHTAIDPENDISLGSRETAFDLAENLRNLLSDLQWPQSTPLRIDDSVASHVTGETLVDTLRQCGLTAQKVMGADKSRRHGLELLRTYLRAARPDYEGRHSRLFFVRGGCDFTWKCMFESPRDKLDPTVLDRNYPGDHAVDAARYAVVGLSRKGGTDYRMNVNAMGVG
jgi:hypothetical protein